MTDFCIQNLSKTYATGQVALDGVSLSLPLGQHLRIIGPSGAGKSTLLRCIAGLESPEPQAVIQLGATALHALPPHQRGIGWVPQRPLLMPDRPVIEQLRWGASESRWLRRQTIVEWLDLGPLLHRRPHQLSGGEIQRIVLARLFLRECLLWLLDEPTSFLDPPRQRNFREQLHLLQAESGVTILEVTHDWNAIRSDSPVAVLLSGRLCQMGLPRDLLHHPAHPLVAEALTPTLPGQIWNRFAGRWQSSVTGQMGFLPDSPGPMWNPPIGWNGSPKSANRIWFGWSQPVRLGTPRTTDWSLGDWRVVAVDPLVGSPSPSAMIDLDQAGRRVRSWLFHADWPRIGEVVPCGVAVDAVSYYDHSTGLRHDDRDG
ncbi:ABC transporter ATP-binding protein [Tuwongella immobilis]|uniref:ABC transporter domain-containing protein n=1 Tax=Tuwongella immobilis TaxID=692036 RepID=A0A6C2YIN2_9BACT|nr:ABC transporter ATP-binding protein [Tuwongella immobilis]VIP01224.1 amino acid abc transporter substrate-binding protein : Fe(3+) ions import ATP-binding protein FbpC OS=Rhizobium leguminosarum bv. trifolii WSM2297 GN=fbpC PE=3 SV=1: ABC_tran [Tuwongella immobilis]VTR97874.1 amino acid abc transporter substrate-binding protein : Fe(3+) ions import ATP-binding protein FbpC OS=Rhizobium leguminosarum bv. trifolii WSM2297 GN=fbpC PE=3 SV=1: ABC_tran [Tuwongella immobilis]